MSQTTTTDRLYRVLVDDRAAQERYCDCVRGIHAAKARAGELIRSAYADVPADTADEVAGGVEDLIGRLEAHRGEVVIYDDYLDLEVSVTDITGASLFDPDTAEGLGLATEAQIIASEESDANGEHGHIQIDADGDVIPLGGFAIGPLRRVYTS